MPTIATVESLESYMSAQNISYQLRAMHLPTQQLHIFDCPVHQFARYPFCEHR